MPIQKKTSEKVFDVINYLIMLLLIVITLYPFLYVVLSSVSDPGELLRHSGPLIKPLKPYTFDGYRYTLKKASILTSFRNSVMYVLLGTSLSLLATAFGAFAVTRRHFKLRKIMMGGIVVTMFVSGGLIPLFFVVKWTGIYDTIWAMFLPWMISSYNLIVLRTFFESIPLSLEESAMLDGANDLVVLMRIYLPLSAPALAVIALYYGVGIWNSWYPALVFMRTRTLYPLQMILREILILNKAVDSETSSQIVKESYTRELVKYCTIVVATAPILVVYPFLQRFFVKGVMIGAIKG
jgi:putative aldouronate transport system permease protein